MADKPTGPDTERAPGEPAMQALRCVFRSSGLSAITGLVPVPIFTLVATCGILLVMLHRLSRIHGMPFSTHRGKSVLAGLAGAFLACWSGYGIVSSLFRIVPIAGPVLAVLAVPACCAVTTWLIGKGFTRTWIPGRSSIS